MPQPIVPRLAAHRSSKEIGSRSTATPATPRQIIARLNEEIDRAMKQPDVSEKMVAAGLIVANEPPEFFGDMIKSDYAKYGKLVRDIGFQPQ